MKKWSVYFGLAYVVKEYRNQHLNSKALEFLKQELRRRKIKEIFGFMHM